MKYIKSLRLINFQSHSDTYIELNRGLNIFVGESDQGKTAIIRALRWLFYNEPRGTGYIRVGETRCEVIAELNDGIKVTRLRDEGKKQNRYIINYPDGRELVLEKFKNDVPYEVQEALGVYPLWIDTDQKLELNIARQLDNPFLIAESASSRAKIIGRIANLHIIDAAQREVLKDIRSHNRTKVDLEEDIARLEDEKRLYEDLPAKEKQLQQIKLLFEIIENRKLLAEQLQLLVTRKSQLITEITKNNLRLEKLKDLDEMVNIYNVCNTKAGYLDEINELKIKTDRVKVELAKYNVTVEKLYQIDELINNFNVLSQLTNTYEQLQDIYSNLQLNEKKLAKLNMYLNSTNELFRADNLINKLYNLRQTGFELQHLKKESKQIRNDISNKSKNLKTVTIKLSELQYIDKAQNIINNLNKIYKVLIQLIELNKRYKETNDKHIQKSNELARIEARYKDLQEQYIKVFSEAGTCPTCGSAITTEVIKEIIEKISI